MHLEAPIVFSCPTETGLNLDDSQNDIKTGLMQRLETT